MQVVVIVPCVQMAHGQQEVPWLAARPAAWARRPLVALSALPPVSVFPEGVVPPVPCAQQALTPSEGQQMHALAALLEPQLSVLAMMILLTVSASQGKPPPHSCYSLLFGPFCTHQTNHTDPQQLEFAAWRATSAAGSSL
jgi:hypothetical protein